MSKQLYTLVVLCLLCIMYSVHAQTVITSNNIKVNQHDKLVNVASPEAQDLGRYGYIPVSHFTGKANVSIPIYSTTVEGVPLNINLIYDSGGVLVNSIPGCLGHNWTLSAGGVITREQIGEVDEYEYPTYTESLYKRRFHNYFHSLQTAENHITSQDLIGIADSSRHSHPVEWENYIGWINSRKWTDKYDFCADIFHFNFMGMSGKFFMGTDGYWKIQCDENVSVIFDISDSTNYIPPFIAEYPSGQQQPKTIKGFTIKDDSGNQYIFGGTTNSIDYSIGFYEMTDEGFPYEYSWKATSWYLSEIKDRFGNLLYNFCYTRKPFVVQANYTYEKVETQYNQAANLYKYSYENGRNPYSIQLASYVVLNSIDINPDSRNYGITIEFNSAEIGISGADMYAYSNTNVPIYSSCNCLYSAIGDSLHCNSREHYCYLRNTQYRDYWYHQGNENSGSNPEERLLEKTGITPIQKIEIKNSYDDNQTIYKLNYSTQGKLHLTDIAVTEAFEDTTFYKYQFEYNDFGSIPSIYYTSNVDYWGYFSINPESGTLSKIIYPTGGYTTFEYARNSYSRCLNSTRNIIQRNGITGGMRVEKITNYDSDGTMLDFKKYDYNNSGECFAHPYDSVNLRAINEIDGEERTITITRQASVVPLSNHYNPNVWYTHVTETHADSSRIDYYYQGYDDCSDVIPVAYMTISSSPSFYDRFGEKGYMRGKLLRMTESDKNGIPQKTTSYSYNRYIDNYSMRAADVSQHMILFKANQLKDESDYNDGNFVDSDLYALRYYTGCVYDLYYSKSDLTGITTTYYTANGNLVDNIQYCKSNFRPSPQLGIIRKCTLETHTRGNGTSLDSINNIIVNKQYSYPFNITDIDVFVTNHYFPILKTLTYNGSTLVSTNEVIFNTFNSRALPTAETQKFGNGPTDTLITYNSYGNDGMLMMFTEKGALQTKIFRDDCRRIVATITAPDITGNISFDMTCSPELSLNQDGNNVFALPLMNASVYKYHAGLLISATKNNGYTHYYLYDSQRRLEAILDNSRKYLQKFLYNYKNK